LLPWFLGFFEFIHNVRCRSKALLHSLFATLVVLSLNSEVIGPNLNTETAQNG
jgi:hypothetical protein